MPNQNGNEKQPGPTEQPKLKQITHELTDAQKETVQAALQQRQHFEQLISMFLGYIQKESNLPKSADGWSLAVGEDGPYMVGHVPDEETK